MKMLLAATALAATSIIASVPAYAQVQVQNVASVILKQARVEDPGRPAIPVVIWAPASGSGQGLILISHGTGAGPMAHADTAQALAEAGFVVAAPIHPGDNFQDESAVGKPVWFADRSRHVRKVLDYMLGEWEGHARLAPGRVGIFGFSAGGTTALISIGGAPDLRRIAPHCAQKPEFVCKLVAPQAGSEAPDWTHDPRLAAAVIVAPGIGFAFDRAALAKVRVPVQLWSGGADDTVPYATNTAIVQRLLPRAPEFHNVDNAVHLSFLAPCTPETPPILCQDRPGFDRTAFHRTFNRSVTAFFLQHLRPRD